MVGEVAGGASLPKVGHSPSRTGEWEMLLERNEARGGASLTF